jgi:hypothetical protein
MKNWKDIKIDGISRIDKCTAEFDIWAIGKLPYAKCKVKVFEYSKGGFIGYTNIRIKSVIDGSPEGAVGSGDTIEEALENTLIDLIGKIKEKGDELKEEDIEYSDPSDF